MEEKFQKQIQRIKQLNELAQNKEEQRSIEEKKERKRFNEHVQGKFIEYILDYFEESIVSYGEKIEAVILSGFDRTTTVMAEQFSICAHTEYGEDINEKVGNCFLIFFDDYVPNSKLAHIFTTNQENPCFEGTYIALNKPDYALDIRNLKELMEAVCVNYETSSTFYDGEGEDIDRSSISCNFDNKMKLEYTHVHEGGPLENGNYYIKISLL